MGPLHPSGNKEEAMAQIVVNDIQAMTLGQTISLLLDAMFSFDEIKRMTFADLEEALAEVPARLAAIKAENESKRAVKEKHARGGK